MDAKKTPESTGKKDKRDRVRSPEELDVYIRVVRPGTVLLIGAFTLIVVALIVWGVTGKLPVNVSCKGVLNSEYNRQAALAAEEGSLQEYQESMAALSEEDRSTFEKLHVYCFLNAYQYGRSDLKDKTVSVAYPGKQPVQGRVVAVFAVPYTKDMITREFGTSFIADACASSDYSWLLEVETDQPLSTEMLSLMDVTVEIGQVQPISMLFQ